MFRIVLGLLWPCLIGGLCSCGRISGMLSANEPVNTSVPEVPPQFRRGGGGGADPVTRVTMEEPEDVTPERIERIRERERDLVWTDPDNPETELQGLEEVMAQSASRGPWRISFTEAQRASMREGQPMVVWFTNSFPGRSPLCRALSAEVFSTNEFGSWAEENVVRLRLDLNVQGESEGPNDSAMDDRLRKLNYLERLKKRYKVLGLPTVLVVAPDGTVTGRYRGYKASYGDFYLRRLKDDTEAARKHHEDWKRTMERRGYRDWTDSRERTVFAKLLRYRDGELILVEPDGKQLSAREDSLSHADRAWIAAEKAKR